MDMSGHAGTDGHVGMAMPPVWLAVLMLVGRRRDRGSPRSAARSLPRNDVRSRLGLACEVAMAAAMGWMAATAL